MPVIRPTRRGIWLLTCVGMVLILAACGTPETELQANSETAQLDQQREANNTVQAVTPTAFLAASSPQTDAKVDELLTPTAETTPTQLPEISTASTSNTMPNPATTPTNTNTGKPTLAPLPPEPLNPTGEAMPTPTTPPAQQASTDGWQTYRNEAAGFAVQYPGGWTVDEQASTDGSFNITFGPSGSGSGILVIVLPGTAGATGNAEMPNVRCEPVTINGLAGMRCFDTIAMSTTTTLTGASKIFTISSTGKQTNSAIYDSFLNSFQSTS